MAFSLSPEVLLLKKIKDGSIQEIIADSRNPKAVLLLDSYLFENSFSKLVSKIKPSLTNEDFFEWLPVFIAMVRYAGEKALKESLFDVQVLGGLVIFTGNISEMNTGEGKTLTGVLSCFLNFICGRKTHVVTVNDYLAKRDYVWMKSLCDILGMTVGVIQYDMNSEEKQLAYKNDVVYGSNNEFGFDYLRDNMVHSIDERVQLDLDCAIIDEIDSVLIDEARVPLVISGMVDETSVVFKVMNRIVLDFINDNNGIEFLKINQQKKKITFLEDKGWNLFKGLCIGNLKFEDNMLKQLALTCLKAHLCFKKDREYIAKDGRIIIVDEFTGRQMPGRRYKAGLHQALEAKEGLQIEGESQVLATITFQKYFKQYKKISGMTGTAKTEESEFKNLYAMEVIAIEPNQPCVRRDLNDKLFKMEKDKYKNIIDMVKHYNKVGNPILVGTKSVDKSELVSAMLNYESLNHCVLNAKNHEEESNIIKKAGNYKNITVATNMAGRGTDIILDQRAKKVGGLVIIGTERHDAKRIDNQLRGRSGRQGDQGTSIFMCSLEDEIFYECDKTLIEQMDVNECGEIECDFSSEFIDSIQKQIEDYNSRVRKMIYEFDDVFSKYRTFVYKRRMQIFEATQINEIIDNAIVDVVDMNFDNPNMFLKVDVSGCKNKKDMNERIKNYIYKKSTTMKREDFHKMIKVIFLSVFDKHWNRFLNYIDKFIVDVKSEDNALEIFKQGCEDSFVKIWYLIEREFVILLLYNDEIGDIILEENKIKARS